MSVINSTPLLASAGGDYQISRSVRLRSSASAYFNRTFLSTPTTYTFSAWVKRGSLGAAQIIVGSRYVSGGATGYITFNSSDQLAVALNGTVYYTSTSVYRDPSAWYHIVVRVTPSATSYLYVNGVQVGTWTSPATPTLFNSTANYVNAIGRYGDSASQYLDGYLTEVNFIDGQALTPSSFGETDSLTGVWKPKKYAGTYGTNGFYLNFSDNSAATAAAIGKDWSGNGNNWTPNNISVTAGATYDSMLDVPTPYADGGNGRGNYAVLNPLDGSQYGTRATLSNGNLTATYNAAGSSNAAGSIALPSGKWYFEFTIGAVSNPSTSKMWFGVTDVNGFTGNSSAYNSAGEIVMNGTTTTGYATLAANDVVGCAIDIASNTATYYKNNTQIATGTLGVTTKTYNVWAQSNATGDNFSANFGQRPFSYTPPTGFKALNTQNLPDSTIKNGNAYFDATTYTGTGAAQSIVNNGAMQPDFVWMKQRSAVNDHILMDSVRGVTKALFSNLTNAEVTDATRLTSFNSNGFTLGTSASTNTNAGTFVGWQWKAGGTAVSNTAGTITSTVSVGATQGFSVVTYAGNGSAGATCGHGLGVAPAMVIWKNRNDVDSWIVYHKALTTSEYLILNTTGAKATYSGLFTGLSSTVLPLNNASAAINASGKNYVAYCFAEVAGFSKFGSYTGNGSTDGTFVYLGFRPRFLLIKISSTTGSWTTVDTSRDTYNLSTKGLYADLSDAEDSSRAIDILSNGFKIRSATANNISGATFIYAAFAENPFKNSLAR